MIGQMARNFKVELSLFAMECPNERKIELIHNALFPSKKTNY